MKRKYVHHVVYASSLRAGCENRVPIRTEMALWYLYVCEHGGRETWGDMEGGSVSFLYLPQSSQMFCWPKGFHASHMFPLFAYARHYLISYHSKTDTPLRCLAV